MHPFLNVGAAVHWKWGPGQALCRARHPVRASIVAVADPTRPPTLAELQAGVDVSDCLAMPGDWLSTVEAEVTCRECIELRHS